MRRQSLQFALPQNRVFLAPMATAQNALICAALALCLWSCIGFSIGLRLMPRSLAIPIAPALGWAVHSAVMLPLMFFTGMTRPTLLALSALSLLIAVILTIKPAPQADVEAADGVSVPLWALLGAAFLASAIMFALIPTIYPGGVSLAGPIFDHAKIAMIDDMARLGVPAGNPFFQESGGPARLSYYYLWHFSAAELAVLTGFSGWEADAGLTWFTAFSSLALMMGFAVRLSARTASAGWVLAIAMTFAIRDVLSWIFGWKFTNAISGWPTGFGGWLFQVTWAPQHVASAGCVVIAIYFLAEMAKRQIWPLAITTALLAAAAFESSTWVGGVTFPLAAILVGTVILIGIEPHRRGHFILLAAIAAVLAIALSSLFIFDQLQASLIRADGAPIAVMPYDVLGDEIPWNIRAILDLPAFWTLFLFTELAGSYPVGLVFSLWLARDRELRRDQRTTVSLFALLALVSLGVGNVLVSTVATNNDLAWRGVLPGVLVLIVMTSAGFSGYLRGMRPLYALPLIAIVAISLFEGVRHVVVNMRTPLQASSGPFADSAKMWAAVRRHSAANDRVANNPAFLADMTNWPINISWALLANRRSCYAGSDLALPFASLTRQHRADIDAQFTRIFSGEANAADIQQLATRYNCNVVVLTPQDGAWAKDPFAGNPLYQLVDGNEAWRIYRVQPEK